MAPSVEKLGQQATTRLRDGRHHLSARLRDPGLADALVVDRGLPDDHTERLEPANLTADGRMIPARLVGKLDNTERSGDPDPDEQRKQGSIERDTRLAQQDVILSRAVHRPDEIKKRARKRIGFMCMIHALHGSEIELDPRV